MQFEGAKNAISHIDKRQNGQSKILQEHKTRGENPTRETQQPQEASTAQENTMVQWITFEYSMDRVRTVYTIRCDV